MYSQYTNDLGFFFIFIIMEDVSSGKENIDISFFLALG